MWKLVTIWADCLNLDFSPKFSCCLLYRVLGKVPFISGIFSYHYWGREKVVGLFQLGQHFSLSLCFEKINLWTKLREDAVRLMCRSL